MSTLKPCFVGRVAMGWRKYQPWDVSSIQEYVERFGPISEDFPLSEKVMSHIISNPGEDVMVFPIPDASQNSIIAAVLFMVEMKNLRLKWTEYPLVLEEEEEPT